MADAAEIRAELGEGVLANHLLDVVRAMVQKTEALSHLPAIDQAQPLRQATHFLRLAASATVPLTAINHAKQAAAEALVFIGLQEARMAAIADTIGEEAQD